MKINKSSIGRILLSFFLSISIPLFHIPSWATEYVSIDQVLTNLMNTNNTAEAEIINEIKKACQVLASGDPVGSISLLAESVPNLTEIHRNNFAVNPHNKDVRDIQVSDNSIIFSFNRSDVVTIAALKKEFGEYEIGFDAYITYPAVPLSVSFKYSPPELSPKSYGVGVSYAINNDVRDLSKEQGTSNARILNIFVSQNYLPK
jgi:hypothetical protein